MSKFKTIHYGDSQTRSINGELKILSQKDGWKQKVELWLLNDITNNNNWRYERLEEHRKLFAETPILVAYVGGEVGDGHNFDEIYNPDGSVTASFMSSTAERIVGFFKDESDIRIESRDGKKWVVGVGWIWQWYAQELVEKLKKQGLGGMSVSIETLVNDGYMDGTTEVFTKYQILGTTILGDDVKPAVTDANIRALSALGIDEIKKQTLKVASQYEEQNKNPQKIVKENKVTMLKEKDLAGKFEGFTVLGIDGKNIALLSDDGTTYLSSAEKKGAEIVTDAKVEVAVNAVFGEGEESVSVSLDKIVEPYKKLNAELAQKLEDANNQKDAALASLKIMQDAETERRKEAVKSAIRKRLDEIKENNDVEIDDSICNDLLKDEKIDEYIGMVDKDGKFCGDERARCDVDARCMEIIIEANRNRVNSAKKSYVWEVMEKESASMEDDQGVGRSIKKILD